jgi:putative ABC transport system permease protein
MAKDYLDRVKPSRLAEHWGNFKLAFFYAYKSIIKGNRWTLALLIAVIAFSFIQLVFVPALISGVTTTMDTQQITTMYGNAIVSPAGNKYYIEKYSSLEDRISQLPGVAGIASHLNYSAFIEYQWKDKASVWDKGKSGNYEVIGIDPDREASVTTIKQKIIKGRYLTKTDRDKIVLGIEVAGGSGSKSSESSTLGGVNVGDKIRLTYPNDIQREYEVVGIFYAREMSRADRLTFVTRDEMESVKGKQIYFDRASELIIKSRNGYSDTNLVNNIKNLSINEQIKSWTDYGGAMRSVMSTFDIIGSLIGGVGLIISAAVMFIIIYINVLNRKRQIGIMRAIGIPQSAIIGAYILQGIFYVVAGTVIGWILIQFGVEPFFIRFPIDLPMGLLSLTIRPVTVIISVLGLFIAGLLAGLIPSITIMRNSIIKIIWGT